MRPALHARKWPYHSLQPAVCACCARHTQTHARLPSLAVECAHTALGAHCSGVTADTLLQCLLCTSGTRCRLPRPTACCMCLAHHAHHPARRPHWPAPCASRALCALGSTACPHGCAPCARWTCSAGCVTGGSGSRAVRARQTHHAHLLPAAAHVRPLPRLTQLAHAHAVRPCHVAARALWTRLTHCQTRCQTV